MIKAKPLITNEAVFRVLTVALLLVVTTASFAAGPPAGARRESPPAGIDATAVAIGAAAPTFTLPAAGGGRFVLADVIVKGPAVIVFYRGYW